MGNQPPSGSSLREGLILTIIAGLFVIIAAFIQRGGNIPPPPIVTDTPTPTSTATQQSTNTPRPPTNTPRPTSTLPATSIRDYVFDFTDTHLWNLVNLRRANEPNAYHVTGNDPYIEMKNVVNLSLCLGDYSHIYLQLNAPVGKDLYIYYVLENDRYTTYDGSRYIRIGYARGQLETIVFPISAIYPLDEKTRLSRIRLDIGDERTPDLIYLFNFRLIRTATVTSKCS